jgi:hypothetical protein
MVQQPVTRINIKVDVREVRCGLNRLVPACQTIRHHVPADAESMEFIFPGVCIDLEHLTSSEKPFPPPGAFI